MIKKRCFILGSGHSINDINIEILKNENVICLNSLMHHEKYDALMNSELGKKIHVFTPLHEFRDKKLLNDYILELEAPILEKVECYFGIDDYKHNYIKEFRKNSITINKNKKFIHTNIFYENRDCIEEEDYDCSKTIWATKSSSNLALMLALYMGFEEIFLLGVDHSHININSVDEIKAVKKGVLVKDEQDQFKNILSKGKEHQSSFFKDLISVIKPMELIEDKFPGKVKNLSKISIFDCHEVVDIDSLTFK
ncbi:hypothetical protein N9T42_03830 [SAR86 cluster bacterium]|nr:hypothetical protein [SAR86 cluster bacterium]